MASSDHNEWFPAPTMQFSSLDSMITPDSLRTPSFSLPAIPEDEWDFGWREDFPTESDPYAQFEQSLHAVAGLQPDEAVPPPVSGLQPDEAVPSPVSDDLIILQRQIEQLRQEISELQAIFLERLNSLEDTVLVAQRYVGKLLPWSIEVSEKYSKLLEVATRQEEEAAGNA
jgi:hypothetical protein